MILVWSLFLLNLFMLFYIYVGYLLALRAIILVMRKWPSKLFKLQRLKDTGTGCSTLKGISIYFSAYNEENILEQRFANLFALNYPIENVEIIMLSDGSTDNTVIIGKKIAARHPERDIRIVGFTDNAGQARNQNEAARIAKYDILLSTDAETVFPTDLLQEIVKPFSNPKIGVVGGVVVYESQGTSVGDSYSKYRDTEREMRKLETLLGIGVKTDGPCVAYRKEIWQPIEKWEDVDQVIFLFAKKRGLLTVQAESAVCYDKANKTKEQEIRQRSRMTRKALLSTFGRWKLWDCFRYPIFSFALFSHKIVRFFSPLFLIMLLGASVAIAMHYNLFGALMLGILILAGILGIGHFLRIDFIKKISGFFVSFIYGNIGFALGILEWIRGVKEGKYVPTRKNT